MHVAQPVFLWLLVLLLPAVWLAGRRSLAGLSPLRARVALALRLGVVTALVLALAEVGWRGGASRVETTFVLDRSRSIPAAQADLALDTVNQVAARRQPLWEGGSVVVFGADAVTEASLGRGDLPPLRSQLDRDASNLEAGLRHALEQRDPEARGRVVLFSDGNQTQGDVMALAGRARALGVPVDVVPAVYDHARELLVERLSVPAQAEPGQPLRVRVLIRATARIPAWLHLRQDGATVASRGLVFEPGLNLETFDVELEQPGFARFEAVLEVNRRDDDVYPQNNVSHGFVYAPGASSVLYVARDEAPAPVVEALRRNGARVERIAPAAFPVEAGELQRFQAIVLDDVPRVAFSSRQLEHLEFAVGDMGVGLIMVGGPDAFGPGGYADTPVEDALPVRMLPKQRDVVLDTALVLVIDRSGSMQGEKLRMAQQGAIGAATALTQQDQLGVVAFATDAEWVWPLRPVVPGWTTRRIGQLQAGGGTDALPGLQAAGRALQATAANTKHVILLTDGQFDSAACHQLATRLASQRITVSAVGIDSGAQSPFLRRLAHAGRGRFYPVDDPRQLPRIFLTETQRVARSLLVNQEVSPQVVAPSPILTGLTSLPPLGGQVVTEAKPRAEVSLTGADGAPLLAGWQYGLGRALAFTSDAQPRWAVAWIGWEGFDAFWTQALRWVGQAVEGESFAVTARAEGGRGHVVLDAVDAAGGLVGDLRVAAQVRAPDGASLGPFACAPTGVGRYEVEFPLAGGGGTYEVALVSRDAEGRVVQRLTTGLVAPIAPEFRDLQTDTATLHAIADATGGRVYSAFDLRDGRVDPWDTRLLPSREGWVEGWPVALLVALCLFLLDVAARRVAIDWAALFGTPAGPQASPASAAPFRASAVAHPPAPSALSAVPDGAAPTAPDLPGDLPPAPADGAALGGAALTSRLLAAKRRARLDRGRPQPDRQDDDTSTDDGA